MDFLLKTLLFVSLQSKHSSSHLPAASSPTIHYLIRRLSACILQTPP